ncbi:MAG: hypothetical protein IJ661_04705 [Lachnospiraceae bacterium]|nr:hypothetical protein [Lachnospiraceae bacterium]
MHKEWEDKGECLESELGSVIGGYEYRYFVGFMVDKFVSGSIDDDVNSKIKWDKLLEIRLFSDKGELLANRTMIGEQSKFMWRIANEEGLKKEDYIERVQTLDIDATLTEAGEGNCRLVSTGGGSYELPISEDVDSIKIISYVGYDKNDGMAYIYDNRLVGFVKGGIDNV